MFAPPDPNTLGAPPSPSDRSETFSPSLPSSAAGFSSPGSSQGIAPILPIENPADALSPMAVSAHPSEEPGRDHPVAGAQHRSIERVDPPARLLRTAWLRRVTVWACALAVPGLFVGDYIGLALGGSSLVALLAWSGLVALNVRRTRPATIHGGPPRPALVVLAWFVAPIVASAAGLVVASVAQWAESGTFDEQGSRSLALAATFFLSGLAVLIAAYQPYRLLARCSSRVKADPGRFRKWFVAPIIAALLAAVAQILAGLVVLSDGADGAASGATTGAAALWVVSFTLPWLAWLIFGSRAMRSLDLAVTHAHGRAVREAQDPAEVDPAYIVRPVEVPAAPLSVPNA